MLDTILNWLLRLISFPMLVVGILLIFIAAFLKNEKSAQLPGFKPARLFKQTIGPLPSAAFYTLLWIGIIGVFVGMLQIGSLILFPNEASNLQPIQLVSISYLADNWDYRIVDLRTSPTSGIPVNQNSTLRFTDLSVNIPKEATGNEVFAEVLVDNEIIGTSPDEPATPGIRKLQDIQITDKYKDSSSGNSWKIQPFWKNFNVVVYLGRRGKNGEFKAISTATASVRINPNGNSWLISAPDVNIVSIMYSINNGDQEVLNIGNEPYPLIQVIPGDILTIQSIWYKADSASNQTIRVAASLNDGVNEDIDHKSSNEALVQEGIHNFEGFKPMVWTISSGIKYLGIYLFRSDGLASDKLTIKFSGNE